MAIIKKFQERLRSDLAKRDHEVLQFVTELEKFLRTALPRALVGISTGEMKGIEAASIIGSLSSSLQRAGLSDLLSKSADIHLNELDRTLKALNLNADIKEALPKTDATMIEQLIRFDTDAVAATIESEIGSIKPILMRAVLSNEMPDIGAIADGLGSAVATSVSTEFDTALSAFNRTVTTVKATDAGIDYFVYFGPDDNKTRPFCRARVDKVYTLAELRKMDNGQGLPVEQYLGGYNCRHHLAPVDLATAKELGYGRGV